MEPARRDDAAHANAWLLLVATLALHVTDEALTHFLDFFNPLVLRIRERVTWFPMPTFTFGRWLAGLIGLVVVLAALTPVVRRQPTIGRVLSWILATIMLLNAFGHMLGSVYFRQYLPGTTSAPLMLIASLLLMRRAIQRRT